MKTIWLVVGAALALATALAVALAYAIPPPEKLPVAKVAPPSPEPNAEAPSSVPREVHRGPSPTSNPAQPPAAPPVNPEERAIQLRDQVSAEIQTELERLRPEIATACFPGVTAPTTKLTWHLVFDPTGREIARGLSEDREAPIPIEARECLRAHAPPMLQVRPPGQVVSADVAITLP